VHFPYFVINLSLQERITRQSPTGWHHLKFPLVDCRATLVMTEHFQCDLLEIKDIVVVVFVLLFRANYSLQTDCFLTNFQATIILINS